MVRPTWYHDLDDAAAYPYADDQYFVGEALLVRAVSAPTAKEVAMYLPKGNWFDFWSPADGPLAGGLGHSVEVHPAHVPVFVRAGHILFRKMRPRRSVSSMAGDPFTVEVYGSPARGRVYVDDGRSHDFESGAFVHDVMSFDGATLRLQPYAGPQLAPKTGYALTGAAQRRLPAVPAAGLRIERIVLHGLTQRPTAARVQRSGVAAQELQLQVKPQRRSSGFSATLKDPAVNLGAHDWTVELSF